MIRIWENLFKILIKDYFLFLFVISCFRRELTLLKECQNSALLKNCQNEKSREGGTDRSIQLISVSFHTSGRMQPGCDQDIYDNTNPLLSKAQIHIHSLAHGLWQWVSCLISLSLSVFLTCTLSVSFSKASPELYGSQLYRENMTVAPYILPYNGFIQDTWECIRQQLSNILCLVL